MNFFNLHQNVKKYLDLYELHSAYKKHTLDNMFLCSTCLKITSSFLQMGKYKDNYAMIVKNVLKKNNASFDEFLLVNFDRIKLIHKDFLKYISLPFPVYAFTRNLGPVVAFHEEHLDLFLSVFFKTVSKDFLLDVYIITKKIDSYLETENEREDIETFVLPLRKFWKNKGWLL